MAVSGARSTLTCSRRQSRKEGHTNFVGLFASVKPCWVVCIGQILVGRLHQLNLVGLVPSVKSCWVVCVSVKLRSVVVDGRVSCVHASAAQPSSRSPVPNSHNTGLEGSYVLISEPRLKWSKNYQGCSCNAGLISFVELPRHSTEALAIPAWCGQRCPHSPVPRANRPTVRILYVT
eukprot:320552-Chlamydomonas_euryale.AAC.8